MTDKYASEYPLPGGVDQYFNSLITLLKRVSNAPPEQQELVDFVFQEYPRTRGSTAVGQYLAHITRSGLWAIKDGKYRLTPDGSSLVEKVESDCDAARRMLMDMKFQTIAGYEEMFRFFSEASCTFDEIDSALKTALQRSSWQKNSTQTAPRRISTPQLLNSTTRTPRKVRKSVRWDFASVGRSRFSPAAATIALVRW